MEKRFNPRPTRRSGATPDSALEYLMALGVSILAQPEGRALPHPRPGRGCRTARFNPRPTRRSGATRRFTKAGDVILFQSSPNPKVGRYQPGRARSQRGKRFQSSPNPKVGRYTQWQTLTPRLLQCFNPRPTRRSGATAVYGAGRAELLVSILAQPEGRALRPGPHSARPDPRRFNPRPTRRSGATWRPPWLFCLTKKFQSSPNPKVGRYNNYVAEYNAERQFQSSPNPKVGRYEQWAHSAEVRQEFQSSPNPKVGRYHRPRRNPRRRKCFNPRPTRRSGATGKAAQDPAAYQVSILAQPEGRALHRSRHAARGPTRTFQSSPNPKVGRYQLFSCRSQCRWPCFNPRPTRRSGATAPPGSPYDLGSDVSILAQPEGRALPSASV